MRQGRRYTPVLTLMLVAVAASFAFDTVDAWEPVPDQIMTCCAV